MCETANSVAPERERCNLESQQHIDQGISILHRFPNRTNCDRLLGRYFAVADVMFPEPTIHESIWSTYGSYLEEPRTDERLSVMST